MYPLHILYLSTTTCIHDKTSFLVCLDKSHSHTSRDENETLSCGDDSLLNLDNLSK